MKSKGIKKMLYFVVACVGLFLVAFIIGVMLPKERIVQRKTDYMASPQRVYETVMNNRDFSYRSDLKDLQIIDDNADFQIWKEFAKNGQVMTFRTIEKEPYSRYKFEIMESNGIKGDWTGEFNNNQTGGTEFVATEHIIIENPIMRLLSYVFFDLGKLMDTYQKDLRGKLDE